MATVRSKTIQRKAVSTSVSEDPLKFLEDKHVENPFLASELGWMVREGDLSTSVIGETLKEVDETVVDDYIYDLILNSKINEENRKRYESDREILMNRQTIIDGYKCKRCGSENTSVRNLQTRSGDEATTVFYKCNKCGNSGVI